MPLTIIAGKPGSGKSYHMASIVVDMLVEWMKYERREGEVYSSSIWTNMRFDMEGLNETVSKRVGKDVDVSHYMNHCDKDFFNDPEKTYWWEKFPAQSVIIIDEVHFHLGRKMDYGSLDIESAFINWISVHRHSQQVVYFLSQHTDQFANSILGIADELYEIVNAKSLYIPFPVSVSMNDIYELKCAFGIRTQYYQANIGNFRGKAVRWSGASEKRVMSSDIYRVYASGSHGSGAEGGDRPDLKRTPLEGVMWFAGKHAWHLVPKAVVIVSIPWLTYYILFFFPVILMEVVMGGTLNTPEPDVPAVVEKADRVALPEEKAVSVGSPVSSPLVRNASASESVPAARVVDNVATIPAALPVKDVRFVMLFNGGVITDESRKITVGETFTFDGTSEALAFACAVCGVIGFESGKRVRF